jgi:long-chain acyl-CoA synthetase
LHDSPPTPPLPAVAGRNSARPPVRRYPPEVDWSAPLPGHPVDRLLDEAVARFPDRPCLDFLGRRYSYREVGRIVARAAKGLQQRGLGKGTRIGLCLPNSPAYVFCYFAVLKAGGTVVNFNPLYAEAELRHQIADSGVAAMATLDLASLYKPLDRLLGYADYRTLIVCRMAEQLPFPKNVLFPIARRGSAIAKDKRHLRFSMLIDNDGLYDPVAIDPARDIAVLQYTGGTTGTPKGAMLTHANLAANAQQCRLWFHSVQEGRERCLAVLPFFHVFAMTSVLNVTIKVGGEIILLPRFELKKLLATIHARRPTFFPAVPTILTAISTHPHLDRYDLSSIRRCNVGGAPLPVEVQSNFQSLTGCLAVEGYGLTEASPVATSNPLTGTGKPGSVGLPLPGTTIEIVSLDDPSRVLPPGERGEICIRGPQVMAGYWRKLEETARVLMDGRLRTGDVGYLDEDGYLFLVDRIKDVILCGGYNVYPRAVEDAIYQHPAVAECVVIGVPDDYRGQTVKAFVTRRDGASLTERDLIRFLADKLSPIEMPKQLEFRETLPKTAIGKLSKKALAEEEAAKAGRS